MKRTKLVKVIAALDNSELRRLRDFVGSPFFNKNEKIKVLLEFILSFAPHFNQEALTEENAFKQVFQDEKHKEQAITKLSSKLYKLIYSFVHFERDKDNDLRADINFLNFLSEKELMHEYSQHLKQVKKGIDNTTMRDTNYFYQRFLVEQELSKLQTARTDNGTGDVNYQPAVNALDTYYLVQKMIYLCHQYNRQITLDQQNYRFELLDDLIAYIPGSPYFEIPAIKIWFTTLQLLKNTEKEKHYFQLKALVLEHYKVLNIYDIRNLFSNLQNSSKYVFENKKDYYKELFDLYSFQLERGVFDNPLIFTPQLFINIITIAIILGKLSWAADFLKSHSDYSSNREDDVHRLCKAKLAFAQENFAEAQDYLNVCSLKNIYLKLNERRLRLKVYYELQIFELIDDCINSFRKFLSKNKNSISDLHLKANRDFVNLSNHIYSLQEGDVSKINSLKEEIIQTPLLPEKKWLLEKINTFVK